MAGAKRVSKNVHKHIYVIDTCVLLHDPHAIYKFEDNDIYIPLPVIDDLDDIKTRKEAVGWAAREVFRQIDQFSVNQLVSGVVVNEKNGKMFVYNTDAPLQLGQGPVFKKVNSDNALIEVCTQLKVQFPNRKVCLVTKDTGLRVRAVSWNVEAENYKYDMIDSEIYKGYQTIELNDDSVFDDLKIGKCTVDSLIKSKYVDKIYPNEFLIFKHGTRLEAAICQNGVIESCLNKKDNSYSGVTPRNLEQKLAIRLLSDENIPLVCLSGPAGTGKTLLSLSVGLEGVSQGLYDKIIVMKPMTPVGGQEIGFLPGDKMEKISAWLGPIKDNLLQLVAPSSGSSKKKNIYENSASDIFENMVNSGQIEVEALTYIQGRSIPNSFIIIDELQNISPKVARMVVERCAEGTKLVFLGDLSQIENPYLDKYSSGLSHSIEGGKHENLVASMALTKVERSELSAMASNMFSHRFGSNK